MKTLSLFTALMLSTLTAIANTSHEPPYDAPKITALDQEEHPVDLGAVFASGYTLVYFYPKANTPGCTAQGCSLRDAWSDLEALGVKVYGVSGDKPKAQKAFREKYNFPFPLLSDPDGKVMDAFGVPRLGPIAKRQAFLIHNGRVVWKDTSASTKEQAADVLAAIRAGY